MGLRKLTVQASSGRVSNLGFLQPQLNSLGCQALVPNQAILILKLNHILTEIIKSTMEIKYNMNTKCLCPICP